MAKYLIYDIENLEPVKISSTLMQSDTEFSKSYITGAAMRGAFIANYIRGKKANDINVGEHREKLLKGRIKFLNAYPISDNVRTNPVPRGYYALKDDIKKAYDLGNIKINSNLNSFKNQDFKMVGGFDFVSLDFSRDTMRAVTVPKTMSLHIKKAVAGENNKIFRYESINSNNKFQGIIECSGDNASEDMAEVKELLKEGEFYLGGSKGSGYGLCKISNLREEEEYPEWKGFCKDIGDDEYFDDLDEIYIYATSDIIYKNNLGVYQTYIDEEIIKEELNLDSVTLKDSFIDTEVFTGFNNKWGYRLPLVNGIKAGSVLVYGIEGDLDKDKVKSFIKKGIGDRKIDGFGRFLILDSLSFDKLILNHSKIQDSNVVIKLKDENKKQMQLILNRVYRKKLEIVFPKKVLSIKNKLENKGQVKQNQWGKLFRLMTILQGLDYKEGIEKVTKYFSHINGKNQNRDLANALNKITINKIIIKDYILEFLKEESIEKFGAANENIIDIGDISSQISKEEIYKYKVKVLKELFRLQIKNGEDER